MSEHTFPNPETVGIVLANVSRAARLSLIEVRQGGTGNERIVVVGDDFDTEFASAEQTKVLPSEEDVRADAARRLILQFGARDREHMERIIQDGTREAVKLLRIGAANWTAEQATRAATLETAEAYVDAIDAASKALRAMQPIPVDFADDGHWPAQPGA